MQLYNILICTYARVRDQLDLDLRIHLPNQLSLFARRPWRTTVGILRLFATAGLCPDHHGIRALLEVSYIRNASPQR